MSQKTTPEPQHDADPEGDEPMGSVGQETGGDAPDEEATASAAPAGIEGERAPTPGDAEPMESATSPEDRLNDGVAVGVGGDPRPIGPAAVPPVPSQPPTSPSTEAPSALRTGSQSSAEWLASHPLVTSGPGSLGEDGDGEQAPDPAQDPSDPGPVEGGTAAPVSERRSRPEGPEHPASLTSDRLVAMSTAPPSGGWRRLVYYATLGYVNLGDSDSVRFQRALEHRIAMRLGERTRYVPVLSRKGGVGKTTVTTLLGMALSDLREDRVIAMDANPDRGTLSDRNPGRATHTARQLVKDRFEVNSFAQLSSYTAREGSRLDVLASDADPTVAHAFNDSDYRAVTDILGRYYSIVLTDSGTGMVHSVMRGTLEKADAVVLVSGGSVDEARLASETLSWLEAHGREDLVRKAIVVVNMSAGDGTRVDVDQIEDHFRTRVRHVVRIPHDRHLAEGSQIDFRKLRPVTREAATELAAFVVEELAEE